MSALNLPGGDQLNIQVKAALGEYIIRDVIYSSRPARVLYSSSSNTAQSGLARDDTPELLFNYMERFMELIRAEQPRSVLLIGGGAFIIPRAIARDFGDIQLTVVELDAKLPAIAEQYFDFRPTANIRVVTADGLDFLATDTNQYDLILLDVYDVASRSTVPKGFKTAQTANLLRARLTEQGMLAYNIIGVYQGDGAKTIPAQVATLRSVFPTLQLFPASYDISLWISQNFILTARLDAESLAGQLRYDPVPLAF